MSGNISGDQQPLDTSWIDAAQADVSQMETDVAEFKAIADTQMEVSLPSLLNADGTERTGGLNIEPKPQEYSTEDIDKAMADIKLPGDTARPRLSGEQKRERMEAMKSFAPEGATVSILHAGDFAVSKGSGEISGRARSDSAIGQQAKSLPGDGLESVTGGAAATRASIGDSPSTTEDAAAVVGKSADRRLSLKEKASAVLTKILTKLGISTSSGTTGTKHSRDSTDGMEPASKRVKTDSPSKRESIDLADEPISTAGGVQGQQTVEEIAADLMNFELEPLEQKQESSPPSRSVVPGDSESAPIAPAIPTAVSGGEIEDIQPRQKAGPTAEGAAGAVHLQKSEAVAVPADLGVSKARPPMQQKELESKLHQFKAANNFMSKFGCIDGLASGDRSNLKDLVVKCLDPKNSKDLEELGIKKNDLMRVLAELTMMVSENGEIDVTNFKKALMGEADGTFRNLEVGLNKASDGNVELSNLNKHVQKNEIEGARVILKNLENQTDLGEIKKLGFQLNELQKNAGIALQLFNLLSKTSVDDMSGKIDSLQARLSQVSTSAKNFTSEIKYLNTVVHEEEIAKAQTVINTLRQGLEQASKELDSEKMRGIPAELFQSIQTIDTCELRAQAALNLMNLMNNDGMFKKAAEQLQTYTASGAIQGAIKQAVDETKKETVRWGDDVSELVEMSTPSTNTGIRESLQNLKNDFSRVNASLSERLGKIPGEINPMFFSLYATSISELGNERTDGSVGPLSKGDFAAVKMASPNTIIAPLTLGKTHPKLKHMPAFVDGFHKEVIKGQVLKTGELSSLQSGKIGSKQVTDQQKEDNLKVFLRLANGDEVKANKLNDSFTDMMAGLEGIGLDPKQYLESTREFLTAIGWNPTEKSISL